MNALQLRQAAPTIEAVATDSNRAIDSAVYLHDLGFNVVAIPYQQKHPFHKWTADIHSPLMREDLPFVFLGLCNVGIIAHENIGILDVESRALGVKYLREMYKRGLPILAWYTNRGLHIAFRIDGAKHVQTIPTQPENDSNGKQYLIDAELRGKGTIAVSVGSVHASGAEYTLIDADNSDLPQTAFSTVIPTFTADSLDFVETTDGKPFKVLYKAHGASFSAHRYYLSNGANITEGKRNRALFLASIDAMNSGISEAETLARLTPIAVKSGLSNAEAVGTIESGYTYTGKPITQADTRKDVQALRAHAESIVWGIFGRAKDSVFRVYHALIERYSQTPPKVSQTEGTRASMRELSTITGASLRTVSLAIEHLKAKGFITVSIDAKKRYTLVKFSNVPKVNIIQHLYTPMGLVYTFGTFQTDTATLTLAERAILTAIQSSDTPQTMQAIATASGVPLRTTRRTLTRLIELRVISEDGNPNGKRKLYTLDITQADTLIDALQPRREALQSRREAYREHYRVERAIYRASEQIRARFYHDANYRDAIGINETQPRLRVIVRTGTTQPHTTSSAIQKREDVRAIPQPTPQAIPNTATAQSDSDSVRVNADKPDTATQPATKWIPSRRWSGLPTAPKIDYSLRRDYGQRANTSMAVM